MVPTLATGPRQDSVPDDVQVFDDGVDGCMSVSLIMFQHLAGSSPGHNRHPTAGGAVPIGAMVSPGTLLAHRPAAD